jgi:hypothetical protein
MTKWGMCRRVTEVKVIIALPNPGAKVHPLVVCPFQQIHTRRLAG